MFMQECILLLHPSITRLQGPIHQPLEPSDTDKHFFIGILTTIHKLLFASKILNPSAAKHLINIDCSCNG